MQTVSENAGWIRRGWEDERRGWPVRTDVPERFRGSYMLGRRRAREQA